MESADSLWYNACMKNSATVAFVYDSELRLWSAHIPGVGAYGEGKTRKTALDDLKKAIELYIESEGKTAFLEKLQPKAEYKDFPLSTFAPAA